MFPQPIAVSDYGYNNRMMQETIKQGSCHDRITEHLSPVGKPQIGGEDYCSFLITGIDQLEEETDTVIIDWFVLPECRRHECGILVSELIGISKPNRIRVWCHDKVVSCIEGYAV